MQRRDLLRLIGATAAVPVFSGWTADELWGLGEAKKKGFRVPDGATFPGWPVDPADWPPLS